MVISCLDSGLGCYRLSDMTADQILASKVKILEQFQGFNGTLLKILAEETSPSVTLQMLTEFSKTVTGEMLQIEAGIISQDNEKLKKAFHKLAGTSELLGFPEHGRRWRTLSQELAKGQSLGALPQELEEIRSLQKILSEAMNQNVL